MKGTMKVAVMNGTGKSSLCSYIYGYRNDYQGIINFDETNIKAYSVKQWVDLRKHSLSMLFQDLRIFTELTALENVQLKNNLTDGGCDYTGSLCLCLGNESSPMMRLLSSSRWLIGSSRNIKSNGWQSARIKATRCCCPKDSLPAFTFFLSAIPSCSKNDESP